MKNETTSGYERFVGRDISRADSSIQMSRGPISSIQKDEDSLTINVHWMATRTPNSGWALHRSPTESDGEVIFFKGYKVSDHTYKDGTYEVSATYAGSSIILPEGDNLDFETLNLKTVEG